MQNLIKMNSKSTWLGVLSMMYCISSAWAFGPAKPTSPSYTAPNPSRRVIVRPFQNVFGFETPNQVTTTLSQATAILTNDVVEAATQSGLSVVQNGSVSDLDPCGKHLEIWPAVTDFTLDAMSANIQFGFNSGGVINVAQPSAVLQDSITLGSVKFAFFLYECDNSADGSCQSLVAVDSDQTVLGNDFKFTVSYQNLTAGGDIFNKTDLGRAVLSIIQSGVKKMVSSPSMTQVPWSTVVTGVASDGSITMLAGANADIQTNQYFTVYANMNASSASCGAVQALACIATTEVDGPSSIATVYKKLAAGASRAIQVGDVVYVGSPSCAP